MRGGMYHLQPVEWSPHPALGGLEEEQTNVLGNSFYCKTLVRWRSSFQKLPLMVMFLALSYMHLTSPLLMDGGSESSGTSPCVL